MYTDENWFVILLSHVYFGDWVTKIRHFSLLKTNNSAQLRTGPIYLSHMATGYLKTYHGSQNQGAFKKDFGGFGTPLFSFVSSIKRENSELTNKSRKMTMECYTPDLTGSLRFQSYYSLLLNLVFYLSPCVALPCPLASPRPKAEGWQ